MNPYSKCKKTLFLALPILLFISSKALAQDTSKVDKMTTQGKQPLVEKYKDYLVPENIVFQSSDGSINHYRISEDTYLATISSASSYSGNIRKTSSGYVRTTGRLRIQNESSTGCTYGYRSFVKYDISSIPVGSTINDLDQYIYCIALNEGTFKYLKYDIYSLENNPQEAKDYTLWTDIYNYDLYEDNEWVSNPPDWEWCDLGATADANLQAALSLGWFGLGFMVDCTLDEPTYYAEFRGKGESNPPYLAIDYTPPIYTLNVVSTNPESGVSIAISPKDIDGKGDGVTPFYRLYYHGTTVSLTAPAAVAGRSFIKWLKNGLDYSTSRSKSVMMDANNITMRAVYPGIVSITFTTNPTGRKITVDGTTYTAPKSIDLVANSQHTISVSSPQSGTTGTQYVYSSWSDGGSRSHTITIPSSNATYTANFTTQYSLTVSSNPTNWGTTNPSGQSWRNSGIVSITAAPYTNYTFSNWSGDASGTSDTINVSMNAPKNITANFSPKSSIEQLSSFIPDKYFLAQNYPNPFNSNTTIEFSIPKVSYVQLVIFNSLGMQIDMLFSGHLQAGYYKTQWSPFDIPSGMYFYQLSSSGFIETRKLLLLR